MKLVEVYADKQGKPFSPPIEYIATSTIPASGLSNSAINAIISYEDEVVCVDGNVVYK